MNFVLYKFALPRILSIFLKYGDVSTYRSHSRVVADEHRVVVSFHTHTLTYRSLSQNSSFFILCNHKRTTYFILQWE
jgi:hypothetical protein